MGKRIEMKDLIKKLYNSNNKRDFIIWNYLWIFSNNGKIKISIKKLEKDFKIPKSSLNKTLNKTILNWNKKKQFVTIKRLEKDKYEICFLKDPIDSGGNKQQVYQELFIWLKLYYVGVNYDYLEINNHKKYVKLICDKLEKIILNKGLKLSDEILKETFILFFERIDGWWLENKLISLPTINKSFTKILNQIKPKNGESKYSKAKKQSISQIDFNKIAEKS